MFEQFNYSSDQIRKYFQEKKLVFICHFAKI